LKEEYFDLLKNNPYINEILLYSKETNNQPSNHSNYDLVIDLQNNLRSRKITSKLKVRKVRFKKYSFRKFLLVKTKINLMKNLPSIPKRYADTVGFELDNDGLEIISYKQPNKKIIGLKNLVGICPGAKHFTKRYPIEYHKQLCKLLLENNFNVVLFGGKIDKNICTEISDELPQVINLQNEDDILQTVSDMQLCVAIICNDSGLMHVASSLNKKLIAIFGSTVKEFGFMPYNCKSSIIVENQNLNCRPCSHIGRSSCPKSHFRCMMELKPEAIFKQVSFFNG
jgi:heptosyltransferase-2